MAQLKAVLLLSLSVALHAQTAPPTPTTVVTVTGYPMPLATVSAAVTVLGTDTPSSCFEASADILSSSAMLNVSRNGGQGGYSSVTIRGGKPNFTLVQVDGIEVNDISDSLGGAVDLSPVTAANIQQVEIVRGPLSAVYGSDSVSGVVNFVSRRGDGSPSLDLSGESGSFWTRAGGLRTAGLLGKFDYSFSGSFLATGEQVEKDPYRLETFGYHSGIALSGDRFLGLTAQFADSLTQGFPVGGGGPEHSLVRQPQRVAADQFLIGATYEQNVRAVWGYALAFDFFSRGQDLAIPAILDRIPPSFSSVPATQGTTSFQRYHGSFTNAFHFSKALSAHLAGGIRDEDGASNTVLSMTIPDRFELRRTTTSVTGDLLYSVERWTASVGARIDRANGGNTGTAVFYSPHAGFNYRIPASSLRLHASAGKGFKLPSFYSLGDSLIGNKTLRPESNRSIDAGVSYNLPGNRVTLNAVYFRNGYHDLIDFSAQQFRLINRSEVRTQGLELEAKAKLIARILLNGSYSYLDWTLNPANEPFRDVPHWRVAGAIAWTSPRWQWGAEALALGRRANFQLPVPLQTTAGGYTSISLHGSYEVSRHVTGFVRIDNLLDADYHQFVGFPDPGIYVQAGVTYHARKPAKTR